MFWKRRSEKSQYTPKKPDVIADSVFHTNVLGHLLETTSAEERPEILDLGRLSLTNIEFFAERGFRVYVEEVWPLLDADGAEDEEEVRHRQLSCIEAAENLSYGRHKFDAVLCWDIVDYLNPQVAKVFVNKISTAVKPRGVVMGLFNSVLPADANHYCSYRILDEAYIQIENVASEKVLRTLYENREVSKLFEEFDVVRSYLLANSIREMLLQKRW